MSEVATAPDALVDRLYAGVGSPRALVVLVSEVCSALGAQQGLIQTPASPGEHRGVILVEHCGPFQSLAERHVHFELEGVWTQTALDSGLLHEGSVVRGTELVLPGVPPGKRFWPEFLARHRVVDTISCTLEAADSYSTSPTVITFHRTGDQMPFSRQDEGRLSALLPHIRRILRLQRKLAPQLALGQSLKEMLEALSLPLGLVDAGGQPLSLNRTAKAALEAAEFLRLGSTGALQWRLDEKGWQDIVPALRLQRDPPGAEQLLVADPGTSCMATLLGVRCPLPSEGLSLPAAACISLRPIHLARDAGPVRTRFGLTGAEWHVAVALWRGQDADTIAAQGDIKLSTVRSHIGALLEKTQTDRQILMLARLEGRW